MYSSHFMRLKAACSIKTRVERFAQAGHHIHWLENKAVVASEISASFHLVADGAMEVLREEGRATRTSLAAEMVNDGVVALDSEIPMGWGLLRRKGGVLEVIKEALRLDSINAVRLKLLERIARSKSG